MTTLDSITPPDLHSKIELWRQKQIAGTITLEEMREAIIALRGARMAAAEAAAKSKSSGGGKTKTPKTPINTDDLLDNL